jgi:hypothetical protein
MGQLILEAVDYSDAAHWRWLLTRPGGELVAAHEVGLDRKCWQYEAFDDLQRYLRTYVAPDHRITQEADILARLGDWVGEHVLGPVGLALVAAGPVTVRVTAGSSPGLAASAAALMMRPLEVARVAGRALPMHNVALVMQVGPASGGPKAPVADTLRMLGLFSLPVGGRPLNLREERQALVRRFGQIAGAGRSAEVQVLQYGVTRRRLRDVLAVSAGWDIVHISGHGAPGELFLEAEDGSPDRVGADELAGLLYLARHRLKLVSVSACWSAALGGEAQARLPGLGEAPGQAPVAPARAPGLASALAERLGCAILAMRYPVSDEFAAELSRVLYGLLAGDGEPLAQGLTAALQRVLSGPRSSRYPPLSLATPALFGALAADLSLRAPARTGPDFPMVGPLELAGFPPAPDRFVGRVAAMTRASAVLAESSGRAGVLLHGMPGGGKTACALELAYTHEHAFDELAWLSVADGPDEPDALARFALTAENALPGLGLVHLLDEPAAFAAAMTSLGQLFERRRLLLVLDNVETLLSPDGNWADSRWRQVVGALTARSGLGRLVLTSRMRPADLADLVLVEAVDTLSLAESYLLARQLPHLAALIDDQAPDAAPGPGWQLLRRVLSAAQGHPKLLELADGQAADRAALGRALETMSGAQYLRDMEGGGKYLSLLTGWTRLAMATLRSSARDLLGLLCRMEEPDRTYAVLHANWADVWQRLGRRGSLPDLDGALTALAGSGLVAAERDPGLRSGSQGATLFAVHPVVAGTVRADSGPAFWKAVDIELAGYWTSATIHAGGSAPQPSPANGDERSQDNMVVLTNWSRAEDPEVGQVVISATLRAVPYLMRLRAWEQATIMIEAMLARDRSSSTARAAAAALRTIAHQTSGTPYALLAADVRTRALSFIDPAAVDRVTREGLASALAAPDYPRAVVLSASLVRICRLEGLLAEGLRLAEDEIRYAASGHLGPWTRLAAEAGRLQMLAAIGTADAAALVADVRRRLLECDAVPANSGEREVVLPWTAREMLLEAGRAAALAAGQWADALEFSRGLTASQRARAAPEAVIVPSQMNDYFPLIYLNRLDDALELLYACRRFFDRTEDIMGLSKVFTGLGEVESHRGHGERATSLAQIALRYKYVVNDVEDVRVGHYNLGYMLGRYAGRAGEAMAHHLAAAVIDILGAGGDGAAGRTAAVIDRAVFGTAAAFPASVAALCSTADTIEGVHLGRLLASLCPDNGRLQAVLNHVIAEVQDDTIVFAGIVAGWDPAIAAVVSARHGDPDARTGFENYLAERAGDERVAAIGTALGALLDESGAADMKGLSAEGTAVMIRACAAIDGLISLPEELWRSWPIASALGVLVRGAGGADEALAWLRGQLLRSSTKTALTDALLRIVDGSRDPRLATGLDPAGQAVISDVLFHIATVQQRQPA